MGFLGLLHMEVFSQRLDQEYGAEAILTAPSVTYKIRLKPSKKLIKEDALEITVNNPAHFPEKVLIHECFEPMVIGKLIFFFFCLLFKIVFLRYHYNTRQIFGANNVALH